MSALPKPTSMYPVPNEPTLFHVRISPEDRDKLKIIRDYVWTTLDSRERRLQTDFTLNAAVVYAIQTTAALIKDHG